MPAGQANTTWFLELKSTLRADWNLKMIIEDHFTLMANLNDQLSNIRKDLNVKPQTFFCKHCNERRVGKFSMVTITSMYFALERFEICTHEEHLALKRKWRKYSKQNSINIYGKPKGEKESRNYKRVGD
jgi:hypothetical protein